MFNAGGIGELHVSLAPMLWAFLLPISTTLACGAPVSDKGICARSASGVLPRCRDVDERERDLADEVVLLPFGDLDRSLERLRDTIFLFSLCLFCENTLPFLSMSFKHVFSVPIYLIVTFDLCT